MQVENGCWLTQIYPKPFPGVHQHSSHSSLLHYRYIYVMLMIFSIFDYIGSKAIDFDSFNDIHQIF